VSFQWVVQPVLTEEAEVVEASENEATAVPVQTPLLLHGGQVVKTLSVAFLADFEQHWRTHGRKVLDILAEKYPQAYFGGVVALAKSIRWETAEEDLSGGGMTPEEIMEKLEQRVGPEGRKLFERFLRDVNKLQAQQQLEAQAQTGDNGGR
jgi:hypothetical protein